MSLFGKRIAFPQFLANLISFQCDLLATNSDKLMGLADEGKVLTKEDKELFIDKAHALLMADITMRCFQYLSASISSVEVGKGVGLLYEKYLREHEHLPKTDVDQKMESVMTLFDLAEAAERDTQTHHAQCEDNGSHHSLRLVTLSKPNSSISAKPLRNTVRVRI